MPREKKQVAARAAKKTAAPKSSSRRTARPEPEEEIEDTPKSKRGAKPVSTAGKKPGKRMVPVEVEEDDDEEIIDVEDEDDDVEEDDEEDVDDDGDEDDGDEDDGDEEEEDEEEEDEEEEEEEEDEPEPPKRGRPKKTDAKSTKSSKGGKSTALAVRQSAALVKGSALEMLTAAAGLGMAEIRPEHLAMPFLNLLQDGNAQVDKRSESYIKGAKPGHFLYTRDGVALESVLCLPVYFKENFAEWWPRDAAKSGLVGIYDSLDEAHELKKFAETDIVKTYNFYLLINIDDEWLPCLFPCTSAKLKPAQDWLTAATGFKLPNGKVGPLFSQYWQLDSVFVERNKFRYFVFEATPGEVLDDVELIDRCTKLAQSFNRTSGNAKFVGTTEESAGPF